MLTRRRALGALALGGGVLAVGGIAARELVGSDNTAFLSGRGRELLRIPPRHSGKWKNGERVFDLRLQTGISRFFDDIDTPTIGINQPFLGPTLEMHAGETVRMTVSSDLAEAATLHWHGFTLPARADGGPHQSIAPGTTWSPSFEVQQRASLFWYHSHAHRRAGPQVYSGLAGAIYVRDAESERLDLPNDYGVDDIPLIVQDRAFNGDGSFAYSNFMHSGMMGMKGDTLLVNGTVAPIFEARSDHLRLRLLNGSNARFYSFQFSDRRGFDQIASDGGLLERPHRTGAVVLAPGERAQIIVGLADGRPIELRADSVATMEMMGGMRGGRMMAGRSGMMSGGMMDDRRTFVVLGIVPAEKRRRIVPMPTRLTSLPMPAAADAIGTRRFVLGMGMGMMGSHTINGKSMDIQRIDEAVKVGTTELWRVENASMMAHPFHIHNVQFRILDRDGRPPGPAEHGLKDTVIVSPGEVVRLLLRFEDHADPDIPYMYHCHILEHEDAGMMGQFVVTR